MKTDICIIGAGPSGLMSAILAADNGAETIVMESNSSPGRKLLLTGGRRCNITHQAKPDELVRLLGKQGRFLSFCLHEYSPEYVLDFFAGIGIDTKIESDGCIFPRSYRAEDVKNALLKKAESLNIKFFCNKPVIDIEKIPGGFLIKTASLEILAQKIIIATGGISYPRTGSTGDGYLFASKFRHEIVPPKASLVPLVVKEKWPARIAGTALEKVMIFANLNNKKYFSHGAIVFTDNGIGGPAAQDMSRYLTDFLPTKQLFMIELDLFPDFNSEQLEIRIIQNINENPKKNVSNLLSDYLPKRMASLICELTGTDGDLQAGQIKKQSRQKIIRQIKTLPLSVLRTRSIKEATVTRGGVSIKEINPKTMESKICPGLFFAGEIMDVDGPCGGYNLQICWSTGALAGSCAAKK